MNRFLIKIFLSVSLLISGYFFFSYGKDSYPFYGDSMGYYLYLPTTFIYHSHKALDWLPQDKHIDNGVRRYLKYIRKNEAPTPKGYLINKYTYGVAAMELPFFLAVHAYEKIRGREANGYSFAYMMMLKISTVVFSFLGFLFLFLVLKSLFGKDPALPALIVIFMGTNIFWFTLYQAGMAHMPLFFLYALLIYLTMRIYKHPGTWLFIFAGLTAGMITLIRPSDIICLLIPLLYGVYNRSGFNQRIIFMRQLFPKVTLFPVALILPLIPQMLYWKKFAGSFLYYSYGSESFDWLHPKIWQGLFSFANGWLIYSPVMIFALFGLFLYKRFRPFALILFVLVPVYIYIIYSWYCYNYINGLGSRPMIHLYPLLSIPLAAFIQFISGKKFYLRFVTALVFVFLISINVSYSFQQAKGILFSEESNAIYNLHMLYKMKASYSDLVTYDIKQVQPEEKNVVNIATLACEDCDDSLDAHYVRDSAKSGYVYHMYDDEEYSPKKIIVTYNHDQFKGAHWIKCGGRFMCPKLYVYYKHLLTLDILHGEKSISWSGCKIDNKIGLTEPLVSDPAEFNLMHSMVGQWGNVYFFVKIPETIQDGDKLRLEVWNIGKQDIYFDDICMELYRDKK